MLRRIYFAVFVMGFTALTAQTILIREFFIAFNGNEFTIGVVLANWILLVAIGSIIGGRLARISAEPALPYTLLQTGIAAFLPASIYMIRTLAGALGVGIGETISPAAIFLSSLLIPSLTAIFSGASFPFACKMLGDVTGDRARSAGMVYSIEAAGFIAAGPAITYILITRFNSFTTAFIAGSLTILSSLLIISTGRRGKLKKVFVFAGSIALALVLILSFAPSDILHAVSLKAQWRGRELLRYKNSIYGNLAVTKSLGQYTFYSNGIPIVVTPTPDISHTEEIVHFAMLSHRDPKRVILIGGGAGGAIREILKYPVDKLIYIELDPALIGLVKEFPVRLTEEELSDRRLETIFKDGRRAILDMIKNGVKADVIIVNLPAPTTLQLNRFYTREFFSEVRSVLSDCGVFECSLPGSLSTLSPELIELNRSILTTMREKFSVFVIPGYTNLFIASQNSAAPDRESILRRFKECGIGTRVLNEAYIKERLDPQWIKWFDDSLAIRKPVRKNLDLFPAGTYYAVSFWNSIFPSRMQGLMRGLEKIDLKTLLVIILILGGAALAVGSFIKKGAGYAAGWAILTTGFTCMSLNLMIVYAYQSFHGFVFSHIAILVSAFMAGLAIASLVMTKYPHVLKDNIRIMMAVESAGILLCAVIGLILPVRLPAPAYFMLAALPGMIVGLEFPVANTICSDRKRPGGSGGLLYGLDLLGSWGAALVVSFALVPLVGIVNTCLALAILKTLSLTLVASSRR